MLIPSSTPFNATPSTARPFIRRPPPFRQQRHKAAALAAVIAVVLAGASPGPAAAQLVVFDPTNLVENALQAARQLQALTNEAQMLTNQARELAASPYSHLGETGRTLAEIAELARTVRGVAGDLQGLQRDFDALYPTAVQGLDPRTALQQAAARNAKARETAQDLARTAAELDRLAASRGERLRGALGASEAAAGQTAAIQSSTQVLAVLSEDLGSMRTLMAAQARLLAESTARRSAERAAGAEARRRFWGEVGTRPPNPAFDPLPHAR